MDMMTMAPKTQDATPTKVAQNEKPMIDQMTREMQMDKEIKQNSRQTVKSKQSENLDYRYDAKEKGNGQYQSKQKKKKNTKDSKREGSFDDRKDAIGPYHIDIII